MKKLFCTYLATMMVLTACNSIELSNKLEFKSKEDLKNSSAPMGGGDGFIRLPEIKDSGDTGNENEVSEEFAELLNRYEASASQAFCNGNIQLIKDYIKPNSQIYEALVLMSQHYQKENIKQRLVSYEIESVQEITKKSKYKFNIQEKLDIKYPGSSFYVYDFYWSLDIEKVENAYFISDINEWRDGERLYQEKQEQLKTSSSHQNTQPPPLRENKRLPKTLPKDFKEEKIRMTNSAMEGIKAYISLDYKELEKEKAEIGQGFAQGNELFNLFKNYHEFLARIQEKKIKRQVNMLEMKYQEYYEEYGFLNILVNYTNEEAGVITEENKVFRLHMINVGNKIWYIQRIENLEQK